MHHSKKYYHLPGPNEIDKQQKQNELAVPKVMKATEHLIDLQY